MSEHKRLQTALVKIKDLESLVASHRAEEERLNREIEYLKTQNQRTQGTLDGLQARYDHLCSLTKHDTDRTSQVELRLAIRISLKAHQMALGQVMEMAFREFAEKMRIYLADQMLLAICQSPLTLAESQEAMAVMSRAKSDWLRSRRAQHRDVLSYHEMNEIWDSALEAIKQTALTAPPGTIIRRAPQK